MRSIDCLELQNMARCITDVGVLKARPRRLTLSLTTNFFNFFFKFFFLEKPHKGEELRIIKYLNFSLN